ncbi:MAG: hypothetical protein RIR79_727 [Pseudomonadota bacterium]|jgi:hypothetical protein
MCPSGSLKKNYFLGASLAGAAGAASFFASAAGAADAAADAAGAAASDATGAAAGAGAGAGATTGAGAGAGAGGSAGLLQAANAKAAAIAEKAKSLFIFDNQSELMKGLVNLPKQHAAQTRLEIKIVSRLTFDCTIAKL